MKRARNYVYALMIVIQIIAFIHFVLLIIEFAMTRNYQVWNFFNMNQLSRWYPWLDSPSGFLLSGVFLLTLYAISYYAYSKGFLKNHLK